MIATVPFLLHLSRAWSPPTTARVSRRPAGFNPGSFLGIHNYVLAEGVSRSAVTTTIAAGTSAIFTMALVYHRTRTWDLLMVGGGAAGAHGGWVQGRMGHRVPWYARAAEPHLLQAACSSGR